MKVKMLFGGVEESFDLSRMSRDELVTLKNRIDNDLVYIKNQIDSARAGVFTNGEYADPDWYTRITAVKRIKGRHSQVVQSEIGKRSKKMKRDFQSQLERQFMEVARIRLADETFHDIFREARENAELAVGE